MSAAKIASLQSEVDNLKQEFQNFLSDTIAMPRVAIDVDDTSVSDKTGFVVFGTRPGINGGAYFLGESIVPDPTIDAHIPDPIFLAL